MALVMTDPYGNRMQVTVQVSLNLRSGEVVGARVYDYQMFYSPNPWGK